MKTILSFLLLMALGMPAIAQEVSYRKDIRPLVNAKCVACHGPSAPDLGEFEENKEKYKALSQGPRMTTYPDMLFFIAWPDSGAIMRRLDDGKHTKDGKPGNMYATLGATEEERQKNLALFKAWIGQEAWVLKKQDAITKEELARIKAKY